MKTPQIFFVSKSQSFDITVTGLLPVTFHRFYYEGRRVKAASVKPLGGNLGDPLKSDANGTLTFTYYLETGLQDLVTSLDAFYAATNSLVGKKEIVVCNLNVDTLPDNYADVSTSHSKSFIQVSVYNPTEKEFTEGFGTK